MKATYTQATDAKLRQWYAEGVSTKEQARRLNVTENTIGTWRRRLGLGSTYGPVPAELDARIKAWIADGWPLKEIAETSGLSMPQLRLQYPGIGADPSTQGLLGSAVRTATRMDPYIMRGLR